MFRKWLFLVLVCAFSPDLVVAAEQAGNPVEQSTKQQADSARPGDRTRAYPPQFDDAEAMTYKTVDGVDLKLYVFEPHDHTAQHRRPAIVFFFGGGWRRGSPGQFAEHCRYLASRGMVAMTGDYRVSSRHGTKAVDCVADAKSAIRWVRKNADRLGVDPNRIVAAGGSAGGHLAACTGVVPGMEGPGEETAVSSRPNALVLFNPVMALAPIAGDNPVGHRAATMKERVGDDPQKISPYHHVEADQPPAIIFFGTDDDLLKGAQHFTRASKAAGNRCELLTWEGLRHGFFNHGRDENKPFEETLQAADLFLTSLGYLKGEPTIASSK